jgi:hypothetical protein
VCELILKVIPILNFEKFPMLVNDRGNCSKNKRITRKLQEIMGLRNDYLSHTSNNTRSKTHTRNNSFMGSHIDRKKSFCTNENSTSFSNNGTRRNNSFVITPVSKRKPLAPRDFDSNLNDFSPVAAINTISTTIK